MTEPPASRRAPTDAPVREWSDLTRWIPAVAVISVTAAVGGFAAVISYAHQHALNLAHETAATAWTAKYWPVTVEGIVLAAGLVLVIRRRAGRPGGVIVWSAMLVGAAVTLAANVAAAPIEPWTGAPDRTAQLMNAWPPLAFLFAVELLVIAFRPGGTGPVPDQAEQVLRPRRRWSMPRIGPVLRRREKTVGPVAARVESPPPTELATESAETATVNVPDQPAGPVRPGFSTANTDEELAADLVDWALERGTPVPRDDVMPAYRIGRTRCDRLRTGLGWTTESTDRSGPGRTGPR